MEDFLIINALDSNSTTDGLSANMGRVLNNRIGVLSTLETEEQGNLVEAINEIKTEMPGLMEVLSELESI